MGLRDMMSYSIDRLSALSLFGNGRTEFYYKELAFLIKLLSCSLGVRFMVELLF